MKRAAALAIVAFAAHAQAEDIPFDLRTPVRVGFAYTGLSHGPALSFSWGAELDALRITKRLAVTGVFDFDSTSRLDLSEKDPLSSFAAVSLGGGFFYVSDGDVGFGFATTIGPAFDAHDIAGVSFATRVYIVPFYVPLAEGAKSHSDHFSAWVRSSLSFWASARVDFTSDGNGTTLAFGGAIDITRLIFLPYVDLLVRKIR